MKVSIIIPCRNEEKFIGKCLNSIILNDYPKQNLEVLVVDGISKDKTRKIVDVYKQKYSFIKLLDNPKKITPCALNIGIKNSKGDIIIRMDSHAGYNEDYISKCVRYLEEYKADNVGGIIKTIPAEKTLIAKAIAICLSTFFGTGGSRFRIDSARSEEVDTVFGGCWRREIFDRIGYFNENLVRTQDLEFNLRLRKRGGKIILISDIISYYYPKTNLKDFFFHNIEDGIWSIYPLKFVKIRLGLRHYLPLIFILALTGFWLLGFFFSLFFQLFLLMLGLYFLASLYFSFKVSVKEKDIRLLFLMLAVFAVRHFGYGLGSVLGLFKLF